MIKIKVNGKEIEGRAFQNMPQALAFAFQNGNCHAAQTLEFASGEEKQEEAEKPELEGTGNEPVKLVGTETTETIEGISFEEMTTEELKLYVGKKEIPCTITAGTEDEMRTQLIAAIKEAEEAGIILSDIPKEAEQEANLEANTKKQKNG